MITDTELKRKGFQILVQHLGDVEAERFVALIQREPWVISAGTSRLLVDLSRPGMVGRLRANHK